MKSGIGAERQPITHAIIAPSALRWFVLRVKPQKEASVVRILGLCSFVAFIPTIERERRRRGKITNWRVPVMPTYVLIGFPGKHQIPWWEVMKLRIVGSVITYMGKPLQVPWETTYRQNGVVRRAGVAHLLDDHDAVRIGASKHMRVWREYVLNDIVRIEAGPLYGFEGKVSDVSETEATVLVELFGRQTPVQIPVGDAVKAA